MLPGLSAAKSKLSSKRVLLPLVIVVAATGYGVYWYVSHAAVPSAQRSSGTGAAKVVTYSTSTPDEKQPDSAYKWRGGPEDPKYIKLPSISTEGYMQNVGVDQHTQIAVPNNTHLAGWFVNSARPGQKGLSIIDGHVTGRQNDGIFRHLSNLKQNDEFSVEMGNGDIKRYRVTRTFAVAVADVPSILFSQDPNIERQLNLITCTGVFDRQSRQYNQRMIIYSAEVQ